MKKIILMLFCLIFLAGCSNNNSSDNNDKIVAEIEYCSSKIVDILNSLNNISLENYELISQKVKISQETEESKSFGGGTESSNIQSSEESSGGNQEITVTEMQAKSILNTDTNIIDWNLLRSEIEVMNNYWNVIMLDLYNAKIPNEDILAFSDILDQCTVNINEEDKNNTLQNISTLYSYMPKFLNALSADVSLQNIKNTQNYVLMAYVAANRDDWDGVNANMINAESTFVNILNNIEYTQNREYKVNKTYMAIKDMQNAIKLQDKPLIFLKYKNLMESLNTL